MHRLTITVTGKNAASKGYRALVDYITAVPINNARAVDFTAAMNNDGIAPDGTRVEFDLVGSSLSA